MTPGPSSGSGSDPTLSVVIVNWNGAGYIGPCLDSVRGPDREVLVVDNGSSDASRERVTGGFPWVRWIETGSNLGFAAAANRGLRLSRGRLVLFLNPDARSTEAAIAAATRTLDEQPSVGLVAVAHRDEDGRPTPTVEPFFSLRALAGRRWEKRVRSPEGPGPVPIDWAHGAFYVGRRDELVALGGYDERYFLYAEDMDLCFRVQESGRSVVYLPQVSIVHQGNRAGERLLGDRRAAAIFASSLVFYGRHHGRLAQFTLRAAAFAFCAVRGVWRRVTGAPLAAQDLSMAGVALRGGGELRVLRGGTPPVPGGGGIR